MSPASRDRTFETVETLTEAIDRLVGERQRLRAEGADGEALECNRLELARAQQRFSQALIQRYTPALA